MQYSTLLLAAFASFVTAQNPFSFVKNPESISVGTPFNITWSPSTGTTDTVTLLLRQGDPDHLATVATIASKIQNTGSYLWTPTSSIVNGDAYAFEIIDDGNTAIVNYSGQFAISSPNTVSSAATSGITSVPSSAASALTSSETGSASETGKETGASKTSSESGKETGASKTATNTGASTVPSIGAAVGVKVSGGLLALVGGIMAAL